MMDTMPTALNFDAARRAMRNLRKSELQSPPATQARSTQNRLFIKYAVTTSVIEGGGTGTLGKGTAKLKLITRDGSGDATYADTGHDDVTVYNFYAPINNGRLIRLEVVDGLPICVPEQCIFVKISADIAPTSTGTGRIQDGDDTSTFDISVYNAHTTETLAADSYAYAELCGGTYRITSPLC